MGRVLCLACVFFFLSTSPVLGASLTLSSSQASLTAADEYLVNVALSIGPTDGTQYFLRGVFYTSSGKYCGYTWSGSGWYNGPYTVNNGWQQLLVVPITGGNWTGQLKAKIDPSDANCQENGIYHFKIERYTASGNGSFDTQNDLTVNITVPTPTLTPAPTPKPTPTSKPTHEPTHTPAPRILSPTTVNVLPAVILPTDEGFVLADSDSEAGSRSGIASGPALLLPTATISPTRILLKGQHKTKHGNLPGALFMLGGTICLIGCGILFFLRRRKEV